MESHPAGFVPGSSSGQTAWWTQGSPVRDELSGSCWPCHTPLTHLHRWQRIFSLYIMYMILNDTEWPLSVHSSEGLLVCPFFRFTCLSILQKVYNTNLPPMSGPCSQPNMYVHILHNHYIQTVLT